MKIREAANSDIDTIMRLRREAAAWLATQGTDQWSSAGLDEPVFRDRVSQSVKSRETWMALDHTDTVIGTVGLDDWCDTGQWTSDEQQSALFVHRMIIDRNHAGQQHGHQLLQWADYVALARAKNWLRLDAWTTNDKLHRYYQGEGFTYVRTIPNYRTGSAALFQRRVPSEVTLTD